MLTITADGALLAMLRQANGLAEIRDAEGNVLGYFTPASAESAVPTTETDWEELRRRANPRRDGRLKRSFSECSR